MLHEVLKNMKLVWENVECPASWVLFDCCDQANEFKVTKKKKGKEKQNDEWWWGANQRIEEFVDRSIKSRGGRKKETFEGKQDSRCSREQDAGKDISRFKLYSLVGYMSVIALFCYKKGLGKCFCIINEAKDSNKEFFNWLAWNIYGQHAYFYLKHI